MMGKAKKITDKMRLDWLTKVIPEGEGVITYTVKSYPRDRKNKWECAGSGEKLTLRQAIDAAMKSSKEPKR